MKILHAQIDRIREYNRVIAAVGCSAAETLRRNLTPALLGDFQDQIRWELLAVEARLQSLEWRRKRRAARIARRFGDRQEFGRVRARHLQLLRAREHALVVRHRLLRQLGDACAWVMLREDTRLIRPLYGDRTNRLPTGIGLAGPVQLMSAAHASGELLVVQNDLTRCLGQGDLTFARADGRWERPLPVEIKSSGELREGALAEIDVICATSNLEPDVDVYETVVRVLGLKEREEPRDDARTQRQEAELVESAELLLAVTRPAITGLHTDAAPQWRSVRNVLDRAQQTGGAFDVSTSGVAYAAVRNSTADDALGETRRLLERLQDSGFPRGFAHLTVGALIESDPMSAVIPPIPLWPLPRLLRVALLTEELFLVSVFSPTLWERAAAENGLELHAEDGWWIMGREDVWARFDPIEVQKLELGVAFAGVSARAVAKAVADFIAARTE